MRSISSVTSAPLLLSLQIKMNDRRHNFQWTTTSTKQGKSEKHKKKTNMYSTRITENLELLVLCCVHSNINSSATQPTRLKHCWVWEAWVSFVSYWPGDRAVEKVHPWWLWNLLSRIVDTVSWQCQRFLRFLWAMGLNFRVCMSSSYRVIMNLYVYDFPGISPPVTSSSGSSYLSSECETVNMIWTSLLKELQQVKVSPDK